MDKDHGLTDESDTDPVEPDLAHQALERARGTGKRKRRRPAKGEGGGYSAPGPDPRDPQLLSSVMAGLYSERGWERSVTEARLFADWAGIVGADIARRCQPASLTDGELRLTAETTAWATQLRIMSGSLLARIAAEVGPDMVRRLTITGPTGPTWKHGAWSVRGARGPRDTYG